MIEIAHITDCLNHLEGLKAVVFDLDDTLYSEKDYVWSGFHAIAEAHPDLIGLEEALRSAFNLKLPAIDEALKRMSIDDSNLKDEIVSIYRSHIPVIKPYDGVLRMLDRIKGCGLKLGLITDGRPEGQWNKIRALGIESFFDSICVTDELGVEFRKPSPVPFELMCKELLVPFEKMCYIGDNINKDFISPERLGVRCIWFKNPCGLYFY